VKVRDLIISHEDRRTVPYRDSKGIITWGIGRNVEQVPFSTDELVLVEQLIDLMYANDERACMADLLSFSWFSGLDDVRKAACMDLRFNLGPNKLRGFVKFLAAMARGDYARAGAELVDSDWYTQVGRRGPRIVRMIQLGVWP
jgi:lysozyme